MRKMTREEAENFIDKKINSTEYKSYHRLYMNGTNKKVGNPILDKIQCLYNEAGCRIVYIHRHFEDPKNHKYYGLVAITPHGRAETFINPNMAKSWLEEQYRLEIMEFEIVRKGLIKGV